MQVGKSDASHKRREHGSLLGVTPISSVLAVSLAVLMATSALAQPSSNDAAAAVLLEQGRTLAADQPDVALGMYRAAVHLTPKDPVARLLLAELLLKKSGCTEAVPELRTWLSLVAQPPPNPDEYTRVVMLLGDCLRQDSAPAHAVVVEPTAPVAKPVAPVVPKTDVEREDIPLLELVDDLPAPPMPMPEPVVETPPEQEPAPASEETETQAPKAELEVVIGQPGWTCRLGDYVCEPDANGEIIVPLSPGDYTLACNHANARPISQPVTILEGQRIRVAIGVPPEKAAAARAPEPEAEAEASSFEAMFGLGIGPSLGTVGLAAGVRFNSFSFMAGTGLDPLALSASWHVNPGGDGLYLTGGWMVLGNGILRDGLAPSGQAIFGGGGVEVRFNNAFLVRLGAGLQFNSLESGTGPLTFDLSAFWLP